MEDKMGELEQEFEQFKALHKYAILKVKMMMYHQTLEQGQIDIPEFCKSEEDKKRYENLADRDIRDLICRDDNLEKFNSLYEEAWCEIAPNLT